ncbi:TDP-N-acetylfucosamine:lipid II N-acetylfucosaminyltransferase, partial [Providencia rettgeri]
TLNDEEYFTKSSSEKLNILIGNSATPTNNHRLIFEKLSTLNFNESINKIYCPLSYGDADYAMNIKKLGESMFGDSFEALIQFISLKDYNEILDKIDIAIFAHNRQQAMGNTINLLGRGKTIFMRSDTTSYELLTKLDLVVHDLNDLILTQQPFDVTLKNNKNIINYFSEENLIKQLDNIFKS